MTLSDLLSGRMGEQRKALVVQGGGMRGVYSMGALAALDDAGFRDVFDTVIGSSAGAINGAYFLAGQANEAVDLYVKHLSNRNFVNPIRLGKIVDIDFLVDKALKEYLPLKVEALRESPTLLEVIVTNAATARVDVVTNRQPGVDFYEVMRATAALPSLYNRKVRLGDGYYVDGGAVDSLPVVRAMDNGADAVLAIVTRQPDYRRNGHGLLYRVVGRALARGQSRAIKQIIGKPDPLFNKAMEVLEGKSGDHRIVRCAVYPSELALLVSRTSSDRDRLRECAEMGRRDMRAALADEVN